MNCTRCCQMPAFARLLAAAAAAAAVCGAVAPAAPACSAADVPLCWTALLMQQLWDCCADQQLHAVLHGGCCCWPAVVLWGSVAVRCCAGCGCHLVRPWVNPLSVSAEHVGPASRHKVISKAVLASNTSDVQAVTAGTAQQHLRRIGKAVHVACRAPQHKHACIAGPLKA